jgi:transmembrane sensor
MQELIVRVLQGTATDAEAEELLRWRSADPANAAEWREVARVWEASAALEPARPDLRIPSASEVIRGAEQRRARLPPVPGTWRGWAGRAAAAAALVVLGFGIAGLRSPAVLIAGGAVTTSAGEMATVTLTDGTVVRLGPHSQFRFGDDPATREVWLEGEAFFSVASVRDQPFTVRTVAGSAVVLGTRFRVQTTGDAMQVSVLEGRVALSSGSDSREIVGGQVGEVSGQRLSVRPATDPRELRSGPGNFLAFRSTPLSRVAEEIGSHFGVPVEIRDPELARRTVTASFQDSSLSEVMSVICRVTVSPCTVTDAGATVGER